MALLTQTPNDWWHWCGVVALIGGKFSGPSGSGPAIRNRGILYARDVVADGFSRAIESVGEGVPTGLTVDEWSSQAVRRLSEDSPASALRLPIRPEPPFSWETDGSKWECANAHGAVVGDNQDDTAALQKAIDAAAASGKTTVYVRGCGGPDPQWYTLDGPVRVYGSVRHLLGLGWGRILGGPAGKFVVDDESAPLVKFQHIDAFGGPPVTIEHRGSKNTVPVESCGVEVRGAGLGPLFLTDCPALIELTTPGQKCWARQLNPEGNINPALADGALNSNAGGDLWVLGMKSEGKSVRLRTTQGGRSEVAGVFMYGPGMPADDRRSLFVVDQASLTVQGVAGPGIRGRCLSHEGHRTTGPSTVAVGCAA